ncbi:conserved hypothetical protein [Beutenbergia cavernae DSM 12333]|uniref:ATP/GTP-binding protein n=1 Tax=Beutenbergia cavernae (strain ATCC BAA-8 / DSM 12333 / CCUG 43141 / JCM 11478 / NBRC 16432 / NCIMB 13614 / HKI 0122) TaxID=471853 RepID=C5C1V6_BEUC1|nr:hypothetical protein [Beutenbergia cavernae]ACQ79574.1 conserved hypothetical protein [Beutenbergia cavernae DSM 12333]
MARRSAKRPYASEHVPLDVERALRGATRTQTRRDGSSWTVRSVSGGERSYRCPGCDQLVGPGTAHVVVWPADHLLGADAALDDRRHWHSACWQARDTRAPRR